MATTPRASSGGKARERTGRSAGQDGAAAEEVRVRMYRHGLGDCLLLSLPRKDGGRHFVMIDCGVLVGTADAAARMRGVVGDVIEATGAEAKRRRAPTAGIVDVLVVTHEHYDHVAGFELAKDLFAAHDDPEPGDKLGVAEVWLPWTENPRDKLAARILENRESRLRGLASAVRRLQGMGFGADPLASGLGAQLAFFGVEDAGAFLGARRDGPSPTRVALDRARRLVPKPRYWRPDHQPWTSDVVPGVRIFPFGPPRDEDMLLKTFAKRQVYHLAGERGPDAAVLSAASWAPTGKEWAPDSYCPFDQTYARPLQRPPGTEGDGVASGDLYDFLDRHYLGASPQDPDQAWRRIDCDWLGASAEFALALDSATNNTSLVLAVELQETGRVLLFAADAQVGNWLSWEDLEWKLPDGTTATGPDLLRRTCFYKVGHHGSHNATLRERGLEMMDSDELVAFLPVCQKTAEGRGWKRMPLPGLLKALDDRCSGRVVRADLSYRETAPDTPAKRAFQDSLTETDLYYEWRTRLDGLPLRPPGPAARQPSAARIAPTVKRFVARQRAAPGEAKR